MLNILKPKQRILAAETTNLAARSLNSIRGLIRALLLIIAMPLSAYAVADPDKISASASNSTQILAVQNDQIDVVPASIDTRELLWRVLDALISNQESIAKLTANSEHMQDDIAKLQTDITTLRTELRTESKELRTETKELRTETKELRELIHTSSISNLRWSVGTIVAIIVTGFLAPLAYNRRGIVARRKGPARTKKK